MCGGGSGGGGNDASFQANIDRDLREQQKREEQQRAQTALDTAAAEKAAARTKFDTGLATAEGTGRQNAINYLTSRGLPADEDSINRVVSSIKSQIPDLDPNPGKYFTDEALAGGFDVLAQGTRDRLTNQIQSTFAPGFERTLVPDTADDPFIASILGEQSANARKIVDFNKARGLLNDTGYSAATSALDTQGSAARSTLDQIGQSVLGKYRQGLSDIRGEAGKAASGFSYGQTAPDIGSYYSRATSKAGEDLAGIEGSIRGAVGGTNYYDAPVALQKGGTMQGPIDITTGGGAGGPAQFAENDKRKQRGLGSSGVF